jgi:hypothetical protein
VFTNLLTALSASVAGWSLKLVMFVSMALAGCTLLLVTSLYRITHPQGWLLVWAPFSVLIFSLLQRRSWLWAVQSQYFFLIVFVVSALWVLRRSVVGGRPLAIAAVLTLCATFSYANGFLMWPVMVPVLWMLDYRRWPYLLGWGCAAALALGAHFAHYQPQVLERGVTLDPRFVSQFVVVYLGNAFTVREVVVHPAREIALNATLGSVGILVSVTNAVLSWRARRTWTDLAPWIGIGLFVLASAALAGVGRRYRGGIEVAMASRYVTLSTLFWVAFVAIAVMTMTRVGATRRWVLYGNGSVMIVLLVVFIFGSREFAKARATVTDAQRACFLAYPTSHDDTCFDGLHPRLTRDDPYGAMLLKKLETLAQYRLAAFGERQAR